LTFRSGEYDFFNGKKLAFKISGESNEYSFLLNFFGEKPTP
jgi:hypothetical protein